MKNSNHKDYELRISDVRTEFQLENTEQLLNLMDIYLSEWMHRDLLLWQQVFKYFYAALVVMILPFIDLWGLNLSDIIPNWVFPVVGLVLSVFFFIVGKGYAVRLTAIGISYSNLIEKLPEDIQRLKLSAIKRKSLVNIRLSYFIVYSMSFLLIGLAILLFIISIF